MRVSYLFARFVLLPLRVGWESLLLGVGLFRLGPLLERRRAGTSTIAFQAYSPHLAQFYRPVISALQHAAEGVEIYFIVLPHPHFPRRTTKELRRYATDRLGIQAERVLDYRKALWMRFDVLVAVDQYARFPLRRGRKVLLMHGPGVTQRLVARHPLRRSLADFDVALLNGEFDLDLIQSAGTDTGSTELVTTGLPFLDGLGHSGGTRASYLGALSLDPARRTALLAPSWGGLAGGFGEGAGSFEEAARLLVDRGLNVVIKLHACSFNVLMARGVDWRERLEALEGIPGVGVDYDADDVPALEHTDLLITDVSSRAFNAMLLDRPVILFARPRPPRDEWDRRRSELMQHGAFLASDLAGLVEALKRSRDGAELREERAEVARRCFTNFGSATEATAARLLPESGRPAPTELSDEKP